mgnify:CR=1 FL=1
MTLKQPTTSPSKLQTTASDNGVRSPGKTAALMLDTMLRTHPALAPSEDNVAAAEDINKLCLHLIGLAGRQETAEGVCCLIDAEALIRKLSGVAPTVHVVGSGR